MASMTKASQDLIAKSMEAAYSVLTMPVNQVWFDYDKEADVLYISFRKPQHATRTIETDDGMLIRKDGRRIVGLTILDASKRRPPA